MACTQASTRHMHVSQYHQHTLLVQLLCGCPWRLHTATWKLRSVTVSYGCPCLCWVCTQLCTLVWAVGQRTLSLYPLPVAAYVAPPYARSDLKAAALVWPRKT